MERITNNKILKKCFPLIFTNLFIIGVFYYWFFEDDSLINNLSFFIGLVILIFMPIIFQLVIIFNHYAINKKILFKVYEDQLFIIQNDEQLIISEDNIIHWNLVGTSGKVKNSTIKFSLIDDLFYVKILLKDRKEEVIVTSLLNSKIDVVLQELFSNKRKENKATFFPYIH